MSENAGTEQIVEVVRERYGRIAEGKEKSCCGPTCCGGESESQVALGIGYTKQDLEALPEEANLGLGCGAPLRHLRLKAGETVLDLGSGPGMDVLLAAREVGPSGHVIGVDMTPAMLQKARANAKRAGAANVEFREGRLEALPVDAASVDAVTSNCVINLVPDKGKVFAEVARVLKPGGRLVISDIILDGALPEAVAKDVYAYVGCVSGAMLRDEYFGLLKRAGFSSVSVISDVDYLATVGDAMPEEIAKLLAGSGVSADALEGKVRSVTYRASKSA
jgi:ubiquinone/menaquinone biosynthesis C-methylase UbiE